MLCATIWKSLKLKTKILRSVSDLTFPQWLSEAMMMLATVDDSQLSAIGERQTLTSVTIPREFVQNSG